MQVIYAWNGLKKVIYSLPRQCQPPLITKKTSRVLVKHLFEMVKCYWYKDNARTLAYIVGSSFAGRINGSLVVPQ